MPIVDLNQMITSAKILDTLPKIGQDFSAVPTADGDFAIPDEVLDRPDALELLTSALAATDDLIARCKDKLETVRAARVGYEAVQAARIASIYGLPLFLAEDDVPAHIAACDAEANDTSDLHHAATLWQKRLSRACRQVMNQIELQVLQTASLKAAQELAQLRQQAERQSAEAKPLLAQQAGIARQIELSYQEGCNQISEVLAGLLEALQEHKPDLTQEQWAEAIARLQLDIANDCLWPGQPDHWVRARFTPAATTSPAISDEPGAAPNPEQAEPEAADAVRGHDE